MSGKFMASSFRVLSEYARLFTGEGGKGRIHKTSLHAITRIIRTEGIVGIYNGSVNDVSMCSTGTLAVMHLSMV